MNAEAPKEQFDFATTEKLFLRLNQLLTNPHGITSNEFIRTGLSKALDGFLTKLPALARPAEESKHDIEMEAQEITSGDAKSVMLRLKTFAHYMF